MKFAPAQASGAPVILGLTGPSRSGKTYSALRVALGMTGDIAKVFLIDTERGRAALYRERFGGFMHGVLEPPFDYARYAEAVDDAVKAGAGVIVIDSLSHGHEGEGGMLDQHDAELDRMAGDDWRKRERVKMAGWIKPKRNLGRFVQAMLRVPAPMIFCFRAKEKLKLAPGKQPESMGFRPICSDELSFEMTAMVSLPENARGVPDLAAPATGLREPFDTFFKAGSVLDEDLGKRITEWVGGQHLGSSPAPPPAAAGSPPAGGGLISDEDAEELGRMIEAAAMDVVKFCKAFGIGALMDLPADKLGEAKRRLYKRMDAVNKRKQAVNKRKQAEPAQEDFLA